MGIASAMLDEESLSDLSVSSSSCDEQMDDDDTASSKKGKHGTVSSLKDGESTSSKVILNNIGENPNNSVTSSCTGGPGGSAMNGQILGSSTINGGGINMNKVQDELSSTYN